MEHVQDIPVSPSLMSEAALPGALPQSPSDYLWSPVLQHGSQPVIPSGATSPTFFVQELLGCTGPLPEKPREPEPETDQTPMLFSQTVCRQSNEVPTPSNEEKAPSPRFGHTAVVHRDSMVVFGGRDGRCCNDTWIYDFVTKKWTKVDTKQSASECPESRAGHTAVVHGDTMYVFGGVAEQPTTGAHTLWLNDLWALNLVTLKWSLVKSKGAVVPEKRKGHTAVVNKNSMYIFGGGQDDLTMFNDLWEFNFNIQKWVRRKYFGHIPKTRMYHVAALGGDNEMLVFGGRAHTMNGFLNDVFSINIQTYVCKQLKPAGTPPTHRMCSTAVYHNHTLAIFTGGSHAYLEDSYELNLRKMEWTPIKNVSFGGRTRPTTVKWGNTLLTFGGCVQGHGYMNDVVEVELEPMTLTQYVKEFIHAKGIPVNSDGIPSSLLKFLEA